MRILFINSVCGIRSTGRIVTELFEKLSSEGNECRIAYGRETAPEKYKAVSYKIGTDLSVRLSGLKARIFDNEGFNAKKETERFIEWADEFNPDILWLHNLHGYYINIDLLFAWIKSRPKMEVRWTLHDCWAFTGHCAYFSMKNCEKWKTHCENCPQKSEYPKSIFKDNSRNNFEKKCLAFTGVENIKLIAPSKWLAGLVGESFLKNYPIEVRYNTIDKSVFKPTPSNFREKYSLHNKTVVLGVASVWNERKGYGDFLELSKKLDEGYKLVLVGLSKGQLKRLPKKIIGLEKTDSARELAEIYTAADVFLNLTYEDNYPTVNLEAFSCGTPCITYRTGGSVESVKPDFVAERGDLEAVIEKIKLLRNKKL